MKKSKIFIPGIFIICVILCHFPQSNLWASKISQFAITDPDLILHNANVLTIDDMVPHVQAIAIAGNRIIAVGTDAEILALKTDGTQMIDLGGKNLHTQDENKDQPSIQKDFLFGIEITFVRNEQYSHNSHYCCPCFLFNRCLE